MRGDAIQVFSHMTVGSKGRQRGLCVCACLCFFVCVSVCLFTLLNVQKFSTATIGPVCLGFLLPQGKKVRNRRNITNMGVWEEGMRREKHSCEMISTVFVIINLCTRLCVFAQ